MVYQGPKEAPTDPKGATGQLATWLQDLTLSQVPQSARDRAKLLILDGVGCALVGARLPWSATAVEVVSRIEGCGACPIIGWERTVTAPAAALLNGTFIQGFELDDFYPGAPLHNDAIVIPSLLACSQEVGAVSGEQFLLGAIAGFEVGPRVGNALHGNQMLTRGWHSGSVFGPPASAAAAGVLLKLDASRMEDALGLAATQSCGLMAAQYGAMCKRMHCGLAARNGLYAAFLASGGYTGVKKVFEQPYGGFLSVFGEGHSPDVSQITAGLGTRWETEKIAMKPYAAMGALHAPLDALFDISAKRKLVPDQIERIDVDLTSAAYNHGWWELKRPLTPVDAQMNVAYALAVATIDHAAMIQQFSPQRINADDVWKMIPKITAHKNQAFDAAGPGGEENARVTVHFTDGSKLEEFVPISRTSSQQMTQQQVVAKFHALTDGILPRDRQQSIIDAVLGLEKLPDVSRLSALLAANVGAVFQS